MRDFTAPIAVALIAVAVAAYKVCARGCVARVPLFYKNRGLGLTGIDRLSGVPNQSLRVLATECI